MTRQREMHCKACIISDALLLWRVKPVIALLLSFFCSPVFYLALGSDQYLNRGIRGRANSKVMTLSYRENVGNLSDLGSPFVFPNFRVKNTPSRGEVILQTPGL